MTWGHVKTIRERISDKERKLAVIRANFEIGKDIFRHVAVAEEELKKLTDFEKDSKEIKKEHDRKMSVLKKENAMKREKLRKQIKKAKITT